MACISAPVILLCLAGVALVAWLLASLQYATDILDQKGNLAPGVVHLPKEKKFQSLLSDRA
ncbi:unnamed protein product [Protopolystoma xenopodis]|uniref:Uncharacterized protein n=1 Tax=Protopolystoma xenopodis TaxID=117903 RepID=A0A448WR39_9PLAT|nr:unnamed protein product [Protopolystoma xenopodis]